jgi:hypothetical protein
MLEGTFMEPILVPGPPKEAFRKLRPVSDLIRSQVNHFKHLEQKLPLAVRNTIPQHAIMTEDDAARYIQPMTMLLRSKVAMQPKLSAGPAPVLPATQISPPAAADAAVGKPPAKRRSAAGSKATSRKSKAKTGSPRKTK